MARPDLPTELLLKILFHAVRDRELRRALRLRLVSKHFSQVTLQILFESDLLDYSYTHFFLAGWYLNNNHGPSNFWHAYLVRKAQTAGNCSSSERRHLNIREIAEYVCKETNTEIGETIEKLCWPALLQGTSRLVYKHNTWGKAPLDLGAHLLCAAAYLDHVPLVQRLLQEGHSPTTSCYHFSYASPIQLAAWARNANVLQLFQEYLPEVEDPKLGGERHNEPADLKEKTGTDAVEWAAISGDINMVRLAAYPPSRATPENTEFMGQQYGSIDQFSNVGQRLKQAQRSTSNVEVYKYLEKFFAEPDNISSILPMHAARGNLEMVKYLISLGADIQMTSDRYSTPLVEACRNGKEDIVALLLELGANPNPDKPASSGYNCPVIAATKAGSLRIVLQLLARGADLRLRNERFTVGYNALWAAVRLEHTPLVNILLQSGVDVTENRKLILEMASRDGLDSMVELLQ
ncbi:hypothetical protein ACMFMG_000729 [Clarireedia jacksonii]